MPLFDKLPARLGFLIGCLLMIVAGVCAYISIPDLSANHTFARHVFGLYLGENREFSVLMGNNAAVMMDNSSIIPDGIIFPRDNREQRNNICPKEYFDDGRESLDGEPAVRLLVGNDYRCIITGECVPDESSHKRLCLDKFREPQDINIPYRSVLSHANRGGLFVAAISGILGNTLLGLYWFGRHPGSPPRVTTSPESGGKAAASGQTRERGAVMPADIEQGPRSMDRTEVEGESGAEQRRGQCLQWILVLAGAATVVATYISLCKRGATATTKR